MAASSEVLLGQHHRRTITISTVVSILSICGVVLPVLGALCFPWFVAFVSQSVAGEIQQQVQQQVLPVNAGMKVLIESNIAQLEDDISAVEYRRDAKPSAWTALEAANLTRARQRLRSQLEALAAIKAAEPKDAKK